MSAARQKGTSFETSLLPLLRTVYPHAERRALQGALDKGDFLLPSSLVALEAKNCARFELAKWIAEAQREAVNAGAKVGAVVSKRRGKTDPAEQWVHMTLGDFMVLLAAAETPF